MENDLKIYVSGLPTADSISQIEFCANICLEIAWKVFVPLFLWD